MAGTPNLGGLTATLSLAQLAQLQRAIGVVTSAPISTVNVTGLQTGRVEPTISYSYRVKIINPSKKTEVMVRDIHKFSSKFESVSAIRTTLIDEFESHLPNSDEFNIGYFDGQTKIWLVTTEDVKSMYNKYSKGGQITIWCDGKSLDNRKRKRDNGEAATGRRVEKENEVDDVYKELKTKHGDKYETPKLRLWSRMICSDLHDDYENPPDIPAFSIRTKKSCKGADSGQSSSPLSQIYSNSQYVSPSKMVDVRLKNLEQLKIIQQLRDDNILTSEEYLEQKDIILTSLRKLT